MTATGRPVFLLAGDRLGVRDLGPGLQGEDVRQLEDALHRMAFDPGPIDGSYDGATEAAVTKWYEASGFAPFESTEEQLATIRSREADLAAARVDLANADDNAAAVEGDLAAARSAQADAVATQSASPAAVAAALAEADANNQAAAVDVTAKQAALDQLLADPDANPHDVTVARAELASAQANAESVRLAGERQVTEANVAATQADNAVAAAGAAVQSAQTRLTVAQSLTGAQSAVAGLAAQEADLERRKAGVQVPADEIVFAPRVPLRVSETLVAAGDKLEGSIMKATDAVVAIDGALPLADASLVHSDMRVDIDEPDLGISATGTVTQVAQTPGTNGVDGFHIWFEIVVDGAPPNLVGVAVRLTVPVESSRGDVLAVPISAVSMTADGSSRVERDDGGGHTTFVQVKPGLSAAGYVEITPVQGSLKPGDLVVVGAKDTGGAATGGGGGSGSTTTSTTVAGTPGAPGATTTTTPGETTGTSGG
jgi:multidrug efflux pump subunit AcrA (membrane-fusion protein)